MRQNIYKKSTFYLSLFVVFFAFTCIFASSTFSKYTTQNSNQDQGSMAVFDIAINDKTTAILDNITVSPNNNYTYSFVVTSSNTEVAVRHLIKVDSTNNLPLIFTISHNTTNITLPVDNFVNVGNYASGANNTEYTLTVTWDSNNLSADFVDEIDLIKLTISIEQID